MQSLVKELILKLRPIIPQVQKTHPDLANTMSLLLKELVHLESTPITSLAHTIRKFKKLAQKSFELQKQTAKNKVAFHTAVKPNSPCTNSNDYKAIVGSCGSFVLNMVNILFETQISWTSRIYFYAHLKSDFDQTLDSTENSTRAILNGASLPVKTCQQDVDDYFPPPITARIFMPPPRFTYIPKKKNNNLHIAK